MWFRSIRRWSMMAVCLSLMACMASAQPTERHHSQGRQIKRGQGRQSRFKTPARAATTDIPHVAIRPNDRSIAAPQVSPLRRPRRSPNTVSIAAGDGACSTDVDCTDCDPCTTDTCEEFICVHIPVADGGFGTCSDGVLCNGSEFCVGGVCQAGAPLCVDAGQLCTELGGFFSFTCVDPCFDDTDCPDDNLACTGDEVCDSLCVHTGNGCGPDGTCQEPLPGGTEVICSTGRCCDGSGLCSALDFGTCSAAGGKWLATSTACETNDTALGTFLDECPLYSSGIVAGTTKDVTVGPISTFKPCDPQLERLGDDYSIASSTGFIGLHALRWFAGVEDPARFRLAFYDASGNFIADRLAPALGIVLTQSFPEQRFAVLDPTIVLPSSGFVEISPDLVNSQQGAVNWVSTATVDVGGNDPNKMLVEGVVTGNFLGQCAGGDRTSQWCSVSNGNVDCPGGVCQDVPDIMSFEMVATTDADAPLGACCTALGCSMAVPWECESMGGVFRGVGEPCPFCVNGDSPGSICTADGDCGTGGTCAPGFCADSSGAPLTDESGAFLGCSTIGECSSLAAACVPVADCTSQRCCATIDGSCSVITGEGGSCPVGSVSLGAGTVCLVAVRWLKMPTEARPRPTPIDGRAETTAPRCSFTRSLSPATPRKP